ncbi:MAG: hypothetical protein U0804_23920 [Gemmataceae bacterium]
MAILVRVLMLVACGPLLVPPGFCVCKAGVTSCTPSQRASLGVEGTTAETSHSTTRCSHRHDIPKVASDVASPGEQTTPAPVPHDDDHAPGCPAATVGGDRLQWVEPTADTAPVTVLVAFIGFVLVPEAGGCRPQDRTVVNWPTSSPLYLTHCSLVI